MSSAAVAAPVNPLVWSADGQWVIASDGETVWRRQAGGRAQAIDLEGAANVTPSVRGRHLVGVDGERFVVWDVERRAREERELAERDGAAVVLHQGRFGDVRVTRTVAHHRLQPLGEEVTRSRPIVLKNFEQMWLDDTDPLLFLHTGYGLHVHHLHTGDRLRTIELGDDMRRLVGVERDAQGRLVIAYLDDEGLRVWAPPEAPSAPWPVGPDSTAIALGAQGDLVAFAEDAGIRVVHTADRQERVRLRTRGAPFALAFSPEGDRLAAWSTGDKPRTWSIELEGVPPYVTRPTGGVDVGRLERAALRAPPPPVWEPTRALALAEGVAQVTFDPQGNVVAWVGDTLARVDAVEGRVQPLDVTASRWGGYAWSPDGQFVAVSRDRDVVVLSSETWRRVRRIPTGGSHDHLAWAGDTVVVSLEEAWARGWHARTGAPVGPAFPLSEDLTADFVPDLQGQMVAVRGRSPSLLSLANGEPVDALDVQMGGVAAAAFGPFGQRLATTGIDGTLLLWEADEAGGWLPRHVVEGAHGWSIAFAPTAPFLVTASSKSGGAVVHVETGRVVARLPFTGLLTSVDWSSAGIVLADASGNLFLWSADDLANRVRSIQSGL